MRYRLKRDAEVLFRDYIVKAPKGTVVQKILNGRGGEPILGGYAIPPEACDAGGGRDHNKWSIFQHDSTYYYIWAPIDTVEEF